MRVGLVAGTFGSYFTPDKRAVSLRLFLCAPALGMVLVSTGSSQHLETTVSPPDPLGGLAHPQRIAYNSPRNIACVGVPFADGPRSPEAYLVRTSLRAAVPRLVLEK